MDITVLKNAVQQQLSGTSGLHSLQLQNHIYGCFIIMEDIAQKTVEFSENQLVVPFGRGSQRVGTCSDSLSTEAEPSYSFDMKDHFSEIGIRYGFAMDTKLTLKDYSASYQEAWLQTFRDLAILQDIEIVDAAEECLIEIIQQQVKPEDAYFVQALGTGSLPQEWIDKVLSLLLSSEKVPVPVPTIIDDIHHTGISRALTEKPIVKSVKQKHLAVTRRRHVVESVTNKHLSKTRRTRH